jgi:hypothetical protein
VVGTEQDVKIVPMAASLGCQVYKVPAEAEGLLDGYQVTGIWNQIDILARWWEQSKMKPAKRANVQSYALFEKLLKALLY